MDFRSRAATISMVVLSAVLLTTIPADIGASGAPRDQDHVLPEPPATRPTLPTEVDDLDDEDAWFTDKSSLEALAPPDGTPNDLPQRSPQFVKSFESEMDAKIIENEDGLFVFDVVDELGVRTRVVATHEHTENGTGVIGLAFLDEDGIAAVERAEGRRPQSLFATPAYAHKTSKNHYHSMAKCSYVYQYANSWDLYVYICSTDVGNLRWVGNSIAAAVGIATKSPLVTLVSGIAVNGGIWRFQQADGSIRFYMPGESVTRAYGYVYWYRFSDWWYYYSQAHSQYCNALRIGNRTLWRVCY